MSKFITVIVVLMVVTGQLQAQEADTIENRLAGPTRADLVVPERIWNHAVESVGYGDGPIGYSSDVMQNYRGSDCVLDLIDMLFRDVTAIPRFSGRIGDRLLGTPDDCGYAAMYGYNLLGGTAGRDIEVPSGESWGVDWIADGASPDEAFDIVQGSEFSHWEAGSSYTWDWDRLPEKSKRLVVRVLIAMIEAKPWVQEAFNVEFLEGYFEVGDLDAVGMDEFYEFASAPWQDDAAIPPRESFEALHEVDLNYMAYGSVLLLSYVRGAIDEYVGAAELEESGTGEFDGMEFTIDGFRVGIFNGESSEISGEYALIIDLGGDDTYTGRKAVPLTFEKPIGIVIDLGGNDEYVSEEAGTLACGNHGIGVIFDLDGDDKYTCTESGIGCAWYGTGAVIDYSGDDEYITNGDWGQGAAHAGVGMLIDLDGDDTYYCIGKSQGFGSTYGVGMLVDVDGDDEYLADLEGHVGTAFGDHTVSFAQGTGYGRRADFGDGHSLGGGFGILVEGDGDDSYTGGVYNQGAGYWWAMGILEDRGGDDTYHNEWYSAGSAPHFAIGCCVDLG